MDDQYVDPIQRLRVEVANRAKSDRADLLRAYKEAVKEDILLTEKQGQEIEQRCAEHDKWLADNADRFDAMLPKSLPSLSVYESKRGLYRNQITSVISEAMAVSVHELWGPRSEVNPAAFKSTVSGVKQRLGQARGLAGALHRDFLKIEVELVALEKRGFGLPPSPVPMTKAPSDESKTSQNNHFDPRVPFGNPTV